MLFIGFFLISPTLSLNHKGLLLASPMLVSHGFMMALLSFFLSFLKFSSEALNLTSASRSVLMPVSVRVNLETFWTWLKSAGLLELERAVVKPLTKNIKMDVGELTLGTQGKVSLTAMLWAGALEASCPFSFCVSGWDGHPGGAAEQQLSVLILFFWAFLSCFRGCNSRRDLNPADLLKSACCWGRHTQFCSPVFSVFFLFGWCLETLWLPLHLFWRMQSGLKECGYTPPDGEVLSELLSLLFKVSFLTYHDLLWPVFTVFAQIRCVWNVIKQYALKTVCPGNPPQCHSLFLDFFFILCQCNVYYTWRSIKCVNSSLLAVSVLRCRPERAGFQSGTGTQHGVVSGFRTSRFTSDRDRSSMSAVMRKQVMLVELLSREEVVKALMWHPGNPAEVWCSKSVRSGLQCLIGDRQTVSRDLLDQKKKVSITTVNI